jgi:hypothetical protein
MTAPPLPFARTAQALTARARGKPKRRLSSAGMMLGSIPLIRSVPA